MPARRPFRRDVRRRIATARPRQWSGRIAAEIAFFVLGAGLPSAVYLAYAVERGLDLSPPEDWLDALAYGGLLGVLGLWHAGFLLVTRSGRWPMRIFVSMAIAAGYPGAFALLSVAPAAWFLALPPIALGVCYQCRLCESPPLPPRSMRRGYLRSMTP